MTTLVPASMTVEGVTAAALALKAADNAVVHLTGNETIAGVKTFSSQPVLPQTLTQGTVQNSTSGTSIDFTSIPSWVKRITVMLNQVSLSGTANVRFRLGTSGGFVTSGYTAFTNVIQNSTVVASATAGFDTNGSSTTSTTYSGLVTFALLDSSNGTWVASGLLAMASAISQTAFSGVVTLSGTLTQVRITSTNGTDTFDAGSINILYE